jgi:hypothetical protein
MPEIQSISPTIRSGDILSFKKNAEMSITNTGDDVVPISARLIAAV